MQQEYQFRNALVSSKKRSNKRVRNLLLILFLALSLLIGYAILNKKKVSSGTLISPIGEIKLSNNLKDTPILGELIKANFNFNDGALSRIVLQKIEGKEGDYAVVISGLKPDSKTRFYYNDHKVMLSASLYKLFLMAAAYRAIEKGELAEATVISVPESHLIAVLGSKDFGYEDIEGDNITYSVQEILSRVAGISDNYASIMLAEKLGWDKLQIEADDIGAKNTNIKSPISTTASDIALFFQKLYSGEVVSLQSSQKIIDLLSKAQINNRIPKQLPAGLKIAHKTGELSGIRHDAGIVFLEGNPYLIVLMSQNLKGEDSGIELLSDISKDVYDYFVNESK